MKSKQYQLLSLKISVPLTILIIGLTAVSTQILIMRELSVIFQGNELSMGTMLGVWLLWTGMGSLFLPGIPIFKKRPLKKIVMVQIIFTMLLPLLLFFIRSAKYALSLTPGEIIGYVPMLIITFVVLAPFCLLSGLLYSTSCQWIGVLKSEGPKSIAKVYIWEAAGAALGGTLASLFLIRLISPFQILIILATINLTAAVYNGNINPFKINIIRIIWIFLFPGVLLIIGIFYSPKIQYYLDRLLWKDYNLLKTTNTAFGNVTVTKTGEQISLFHNGLYLFTIPDQLAAEESVHYSLLQHKNPKEILMIGGNVQASITEALKHPSLKSIHYVEIDPAIIKYSLQFGGSSMSEILSNDKVKIKNIDGRLFIKQTNKKFDLVILNLPHPYTAQLNRFYTIEFFREVDQILKNDGIISIALEGAANVISPELSDYLSMIQTTLKKVFPETVILPGETIRIFASQNKKYLTTDPDKLVERLHNRNINTKFIREYYLPYQLSPERRAYVNSKITPPSQTVINHDLHPLGYYYHTLLWSTAYMTGFKEIFRFISKITMWQIIIFILIIFLIIFIFTKKNSSYAVKCSVAFSIIGVGFTEISLEFILILAFQILHGYVYQMLAVLIGGYMVGLALGGWISILPPNLVKDSSQLFQRIQCFMVILPVIVGMLINIFHNLKVFTTNTALLAIPFAAILTLSGFLGGYQFTIGNRLFYTFKKTISQTAGFLYCMDLMGSAAGALVTSAFLIPILGINKTLVILACLNFFAFLLLKISLKTFKTIK